MSDVRQTYTVDQPHCVAVGSVDTFRFAVRYGREISSRQMDPGITELKAALTPP
jgi:hypothetical protein